jgi:hypothetical protein
MLRWGNTHTGKLMADILKVKSGKMEQYRTKGCRVVEVIHHGSLVHSNSLWVFSY